MPDKEFFLCLLRAFSYGVIGLIITIILLFLFAFGVSLGFAEVTPKILTYLYSVGCRPSTEVIQSIKVDPNHRFYGSYSDGQIIVRSLEDERTLVHELYHSCQKKATNYNEWWLNEIEAKGVEMKWVNQGK